jgi:hypothetical protein
MVTLDPDRDDSDWLKQGRGESSLVWYGERGIINSIVYAITSHNQMRELVKLIEWADEKEKQWTNCLKNSTIIIEMQLNDFGSPDLIIVIKDCNGEHHFLFVEAKTSSYFENAITNSYGMVRGYNSKINGQLSLKYRFVKALENWDGKTHEITEPPEIYEAYHGLIHDYSDRPRTLKHGPIIEDILKNHQFEKANNKNSYYVALTLEDIDYNPFIDAENTDVLPVFLDEKGNNIWASLQGNVGSINLAELKKIIGDPAFKKVYEIMVKKKEISVRCEYPQLRTINLSNFSDDVRSRCRFFGEKMLQSSDAVSLDQKAGSFSLLDETGIVIGKIIPREDEIWYGVRESKQMKNLTYENRGKWCIGNVPFIFYTVE